MSKNPGEKTKIRVGGSNRVSLAFTDEMLDENAEIDLMAGIDDQPHIESAAAFNRRKSTVRRRSSIGIGHKPSGSLLDDEQNANLAEMYKTVIQLSTEGKLNEKNSWKYNLIDHMGKLIRDESKGVNFQKASCTLDASVKIYSNRVDDTYSTSHRVLESLSRNNNEIDANILGEETVPHRVKPVKVGTKSSSTRLNIAQTIEKNPEAINAVKLEHDYAFDPMFHKISKAFDEGGSKGMLLYNMRLSSKSSALSFVGKGVEQRWNAAEDKSVADQNQLSVGGTINMRDLVNRSKITLGSILDREVCPKLAEYRRFVNIDQSAVGTIAKDEIKSASSEPVPIAYTTMSQTLTTPMDPNAMAAESHFPSVDDYDGDNGGGDYYGGFDEYPSNNFDDIDNLPVEESKMRSSSSSSSIATGVQEVIVNNGNVQKVETTKLLWTPKTEAEKIEQAQANLKNIPIKATEYGFIDMDQLTDNNSWAGAQHWKKARLRKTKETESETSSLTDVASIGSELNPKEVKAVSTKGKKSAAAPKKDIKNGGFILTLDLVDASKFTVPSGRSKVDTTVMTNAAREKAISTCSSLLLPSDEHLRVHDLCRLFLLPSVIVPPKKISNLIKNSATANSSKPNGKNGGSRAKAVVNNIITGDEQVWAKDERGMSIVPYETSVSGSAIATEQLEPQYDDDYNTGMYGDDYGDDHGGNSYNDEVFTTAAPISIENIDKSPSSGNPLANLTIDDGKLVQASRVVEKIEINYAKVSKRVDVHKLKGDVWNGIEQSLGDNEDFKNSPVPLTPVAQTEELSFQKLVKDLSGGEEKQQQKDVSLAYYFICLLHLANENTLKISGQEDMSDLKIKYDR